MFRIPEVPYPLVIDTIGKMLAMGSELTIHCHTDGCNHSGQINLVALGYRLGFDHGCMDEDLRRYFYCPKCRKEGRPDRKFAFTHHALTNPHSPWPRKPNAYAKAKGG